MLYYKIEVEHQDKYHPNPHTEIIEDLKYFTAIEVSEQSRVEIFLVAEVDDGEIARIEAEDAGEGDDDDGECPACLHGGEWDDQYGASDHAIDECENGCW